MVYAHPAPLKTVVIIQQNINFQNVKKVMLDMVLAVVQLRLRQTVKYSAIPNRVVLRDIQR